MRGGREPVSWAGGVMTKEGRVEDVGRNRGMFSAERKRERERLRDCSGICFHFRKVLELMCIS